MDTGCKYSISVTVINAVCTHFQASIETVYFELRKSHGSQGVLWFYEMCGCFMHLLKAAKEVNLKEL